MEEKTKNIHLLFTGRALVCVYNQSGIKSAQTAQPSAMEL